MKIEVLTFDADPDHGGFGARVHSLIRLLAEFADVRVVLTDWFQAPSVPRVEYVRQPVPETSLTRLRRLRTYYRTDFPPRTPREPTDLTIVESLDLLGLYLPETGGRLLMDLHNVWWELLQYEMVNAPFFKSWLGRRSWVRGWLLPRLQRRAKTFEVEALHRAAGVMVTSEADRDKLLRALPDLTTPLHVVPNCVDLDAIPQTPPSGGDAVLFVGGFNYVPNREAATFIAEELAPRLPETTFLLVGSHPPALDTPNVRALGFVEDLSDVFPQAAVCVAPLTQGSGTRLKVLTYLAAGKAVVATRKAVEGLAVEDGRHLLLREKPAEFAEAVQDLLEDPARRASLGRTGRELVEASYDWRVHVAPTRAFLKRVLDGAA